MKIHFVGIGGMGMSALAIHRFLMGDSVSGSDIFPGERTMYLKKLGLRVEMGHSPDNLREADLVIASRAVPDDNVELIKARKMGLKILKREEFLLDNLENMRPQIAITGTDGKTTTTAMVFHALRKLGENPFSFLGGLHSDLRYGNYHNGDSGVVFELDESNPFFVRFKPTHLIITNARGDHLENFRGGVEEYVRLFEKLVSNTEGLVVTFSDDEFTGKLGDISFGVESGDFRFVDREVMGLRQRFIFKFKGRYHSVELNVPGFHNCLNALAVLSLLNGLGYPLRDVEDVFRDFSGVHRRFTISFADEERGIYIIDDYAHTPEEIFTLIETAREVFPEKKLIAVFQPHRFTRTKRENGRFAMVLSKADKVYVTEIYDAFERGNGVDSTMVVEELERLGSDVEYIPDLGEINDIELEENGVYLFIGAGDIVDYSKRFIESIGGSRI